MIITTVKNAKFDTGKPARSNTIMYLDDNGNQVMDKLRLTGNMTIVVEFMEQVSMIEVDTSFGLQEVNEDFIWQ